MHRRVLVDTYTSTRTARSHTTRDLSWVYVLPLRVSCHTSPSQAWRPRSCCVNPRCPCTSCDRRMSTISGCRWSRQAVQSFWCHWAMVSLTRSKSCQVCAIPWAFTSAFEQWHTHTYTHTHTHTHTHTRTQYACILYAHAHVLHPRLCALLPCELPCPQIPLLEVAQAARALASVRWPSLCTASCASGSRGAGQTSASPQAISRDASSSHSKPIC